MDWNSIDFEGLVEPIAEDLKKAGRELLEAAEEDLNIFVKDIAADTVRVLAEPDSEARQAKLSELRGQLALVGERQRIRANQRSWEIFGMVMETATTVASRALTAAIAAI